MTKGVWASERTLPVRTPRLTGAMPPPVNPLANKLAYYLSNPDAFVHMHPCRRRDLLVTLKVNCVPKWTMLVDKHNDQLEIDKLRMSKRVNLQDMFDDPVRGGEWDWPLRLIARWSMAVDVDAPRMFLLNKQCEYAWRLAAKTNEIDIKAYQRNVNLFIRSAKGSMPKPEKPIAQQYIGVSEARTLKKQEFLMHGWALTPLSGAELRKREREKRESGSKEVEYMGAAEAVHEPGLF